MDTEMALLKDSNWDRWTAGLKEIGLVFPKDSSRVLHSDLTFRKRKALLMLVAQRVVEV